MALTQVQVNRILAELSKRTQNGLAPGSGCPLCGQHNWTLGPAFVPIVTHDSPTESIPGVMNLYYPCVSFTCKNCGNMQFVNIRVLGLLDIAEGKDALAEASPAQFPAPPTAAPAAGTGG